MKNSSTTFQEFIVTPRLPMSVHKKFSPFGSAVWPARGNIYMNVLFSYIDYSS